MADFVSAAQVAKRFDVTSRTIVRWIDEGVFPGAFKVNPSIKNSPYLIPQSSIDEYEQKREEERQEQIQVVEAGSR